MISDENPAKPNSEHIESNVPPVLEYQAPGTVGDQWTSLMTAHSVEEANLVVSYLQQHGLHARVDGENSGGAWGRIPARVHVLRRDVEQATEMLAEIDRRRAERISVTAVRCPQCGGEPRPLLHPLRKVAWAMWLGLWIGFSLARILDFPISEWLALLLPVGLVLMLWKVMPRWKCPACDIQWSQSETDDAIDDDDQDVEANEMHENKKIQGKDI